MEETTDADYQLSKEDDDVLNDEAISKLVEADKKFSDEVAQSQGSSLSYRYKKLTSSTQTDLTTATIRGAEDVSDESVLLQIDHEGERKHLHVYRDGSGTPTVEDLLTVVSADSFSDLWGEKIPVFPSQDGTLADRAAVRGASRPGNKIRRKLIRISTELNLAGVTTSDHPYIRQNTTTPTPSGIAALWSLTGVSIGLVFLLMQIPQVLPETILSAAIIAPLLFIVTTIASLSTIVGSFAMIFTTFTMVYLLTGVTPKDNDKF